MVLGCISHFSPAISLSLPISPFIKARYGVSLSHARLHSNPNLNRIQRPDTSFDSRTQRPIREIKMFKSIVSKVASVIAAPPPSPTTTSTEDFYPGRLCFSPSTASSSEFGSIGNLRSVTREEIYWSASECDDSYFGDESDLNNLSTVEESEDTSVVFPGYCGPRNFHRLEVYRVRSCMVVGLFVGRTFELSWNAVVEEGFYI
jgi:hypothetical protein